MEHILFLYNAEVNLQKSLKVPEAQAALAWRTLFQCCLRSPYLLDQVLALSAAHLSTEQEDKRKIYENEATTLQTRALATFKASQPHSQPNADYLPIVLYSSFLALHVLFDTFRCRQSFNLFMDRYTTYLSVHRGVHATMPPGIFDRLLPEMRPFTGELNLDSSPHEIGVVGSHECQPLVRLMEDADPTHPSTIACNEALRSLQSTYNMCRRRASMLSHIQYVTIWPVTISSEFIVLIKQRRPEAMLILAYYAVLLHDLRDFWVFGDGGRYLVQSISEHLGTFWDEFLAWPIEAVKS
jgi:hypothetical protein